MSDLIIPPLPEMKKKWGPLAYVSDEERDRILHLPAGQAKAVIANLERAIAAALKRRGGAILMTSVESPSVEIRIERWHPARLNEMMGGHWSKGHGLKKRDREMIWAYSRGKTTATAKRRLELTIILKPKQRGGDPDSYFKSVCDALKLAGLLVDDNRQGVELMPVIYERGSETLWGTVIRLTDITRP